MLHMEVNVYCIAKYSTARAIPFSTLSIFSKLLKLSLIFTFANLYVSRRAIPIIEGFLIATTIKDSRILLCMAPLMLTRLLRMFYLSLLSSGKCLLDRSA